MKTINEEIAAIDDTLRSFNINRPDIKELWETGRFGTIAVPADRYKQYYDTIKSLQAQLAERDRMLTMFNAATKVYYENYMQDEADSAENCVCGELQHLAAIVVKDTLAQYKAAITKPTEE